MSKINRRPVRRTAAGVLASTLMLSGVVAAGISPANAAAGFNLTRIQGNDRYETSAAVATAFGTATNVIVASGEAGRSADALAASFLAGVQNAPVLLTRRDTTPEPILASLRTLRTGGATTLTVIGGTAAVSAEQLASFRTLGFTTVNRIEGADRFATAAAVAAAGESAAASNIGLIASGVTTIDALAGGPLAYKGKHPLFLTSRTGIRAEVLAALKSTGVTSVYVLGGEAAVGPEVVATLAANGITVAGRLAGADRSATSAAIATALVANFGFDATTFNLASGANEGIDALSGAALSGKQNRALLVTNTAASAAPVVAYATANAARLNTVGSVFGGTAAVTDALLTSIVNAGRGVGNFNTLTVAPTAAETRTLANEDPAGTLAVRNADNRTYTATGLDPQGVYRITLVNSASIQTAANGSVTFLSSAIAGSTTTFAVDPGADIADIVSVNGSTTLTDVSNTGGTPTAGAFTVTATPTSAGVITFEIDGVGAGSVTPVVYINNNQGGTATTGGASPRLETSATAAGQFAAATETFGLGGTTTFILPGAPGGAFGGTSTSTVTGVNKAANQFNSGGFTFTYDANDTFTINSVPATLAEFAAQLSSGDVIGGVFAPNAALASTFNLTDGNPPTPAVPTVTVVPGAANSNDLNVAVALPSGADIDSVVIQRAPVTGLGTGTVGAFTTVATLTPTAAQVTAGTLNYVDENLPAGSYRYQVAFVNDGDSSPFAATTTNAVTTTPTAAETTAPTIAEVRAGEGTGATNLVGVADAGDTIRFVFSEAMAPAVATGSFQVQDVDGTIATISCATGAGAAVTCTLQGAGTFNGTARAANTVLDVVLNATPTATGGTNPGLQYPLTITTVSAAFDDAAGNQLNLGGSADRSVESGTLTGGPTV